MQVFVIMGTVWSMGSYFWRDFDCGSGYGQTHRTGPLPHRSCKKPVAKVELGRYAQAADAIAILFCAFRLLDVVARAGVAG